MTTFTPPPPLRIGSLVLDPPLLQAPMAGYTNYAFRQVVREFGGVGLQATEMISAQGFLWLESHEQEYPDRLWGIKDEARPLAVQIWDNDPQTLAAVGQKLATEFQVSVVDINFGCPVKQVTQRAHSGSYLLRDPDRVGAIIEQVVKACAPTPVTAKIRLGCTHNTVNAITIAQVVEQAGAAALTVHGRVAADFFRGSADWEKIAAIKPHLKRIPLIGNGDITTPEAAVTAFARYGVDGVMIARAALAKPWLYAQCAAALKGEPIPPDPTPLQEMELIRHHFALVRQRFGDERGTNLMRKFATCYAQGKPGAREFRGKITHVNTPAEFEEVLANYFPKELPRPSRRTQTTEQFDDCSVCE
jgi:tRNA-dihydrouridine synthase B